MGSCCSKEPPNTGPVEPYVPSPVAVPSTTRGITETRVVAPKLVVDPRIVDELILELLALIASFVDK